MAKTGIVVLHYKGEKDTLECLSSLAKQTNRSSTIIIVVANSISDDFRESLTKNFPQIVLIANSENIGFSGGNNEGIEKALSLGCSNIILLNNDTLVSNDLVMKLTQFADTDSTIGLISPKIYFARGFEYHKNRYTEKEKGKVIWFAGGQFDKLNIYASHCGVDEIDRGQYDKITDTDFATGCCLLIKKNLIEKIGLLDGKYFMYFEDIDYSIRAKLAGFRTVYYPETCLWHKNASSSGKPGSDTHIYYQTRNRLYFGFKYASWYVKKSLFIDSLKLLMKGSVYTKAVLDYYFGKMGKGII